MEAIMYPIAGVLGLVMYYYVFRALGRGAKKAIQHPDQTMRWIKFFVDISRK